MWLFSGLPLLPPCLVLWGPPGPTGTEWSQRLPSLIPMAKLLLVQLRRLLDTCTKGQLLAHINFVSTRGPSFFPAKLLPVWSDSIHSSAWIYFFPGGELHIYSLWWTLCGSWLPFLQILKTLSMAAQHSGVSATPHSFISSTKQVPDPNIHEVDWTRRSLDGKISSQICLSSTGSGCPGK